MDQSAQESAGTARCEDFDWSSILTSDGLARISQTVSPKFLARHVPLEARFISHIVMAHEGWRCWPGKHRQILMQRLLKLGQEELWVGLHEQSRAALQEILARATPVQARQLRKLWVKLEIWGRCRALTGKSSKVEPIQTRIRR